MNDKPTVEWLGWGVILSRPPWFHVEYGGDETTAWKHALGWPSQEEIDHAKALGARAFPVRIMEFFRAADMPQTPPAAALELARLRDELLAMQRRAQAFEVGSADLQSQRDKMRAVLEWTNLKGGLGLDVHQRISDALGKLHEMQNPAKETT